MSTSTDVQSLRDLAAWHMLHAKKRGSKRGRSQEKEAAHHREAAALLLRMANTIVHYVQFNLPGPTIVNSPARELDASLK